MVVLAILVVGIIVARRRYVASQRPPSTLHGPYGTSPYRMTPVPNSPTSPGYDAESIMRQKLYVGSIRTVVKNGLAQSYSGSIRSHDLPLPAEL